MFGRFFSLLSLLCVGACASFVSAQAPLATARVGGIDDLQARVDYISKLANEPKLTEMFQAGLQSPEMAKVREAFDAKRPILAAANMNGQTPAHWVFAPLGDEGALVELLQLEEKGKGYYQSKVAPAFVRIAAPWAIGSQQLELLQGDIPSASVIEAALPAGDDVAVAINCQRIPEFIMQAFQQGMQQGLQQQLQNRPEGTSDAEWLATTTGIEFFGKIISAVVRDADSISTGLRLSPKEKKFRYGFNYSAKSGSTVANALAASGRERSVFSAFPVDDAAFSATVCLPLSADTQNYLNTLMKVMTTEFEKEVAKEKDKDDESAVELARELFEHVSETIKTGHLEAFVCLLGVEDSDDHSIIVAFPLHGAEEIGKMVVEAIEEEDDAEVVLNAAKHRDVAIHRLVPDDDDIEELEQFNEEPVISFAFAKDMVYFSVGGKSDKPLQTVIDAVLDPKAKQPAPPLRIEMDLELIADFAESLPEADEKAVAMMRKAVGSEDDNYFRIVATSGAKGLELVTECGEGFLRLLAVPFAQGALGKAE